MIFVECGSCYTFRATAYRLTLSRHCGQSFPYINVNFYIYTRLFFHLHLNLFKYLPKFRSCVLFVQFIILQYANYFHSSFFYNKIPFSSFLFLDNSTTWDYHLLFLNIQDTFIYLFLLISKFLREPSYLVSFASVRNARSRVFNKIKICV